MNTRKARQFQKRFDAGFAHTFTGHNNLVPCQANYEHLRKFFGSMWLDAHDNCAEQFHREVLDTRPKTKTEKLDFRNLEAKYFRNCALIAQVLGF